MLRLRAGEPEYSRYVLLPYRFTLRVFVFAVALLVARLGATGLEAFGLPAFPDLPTGALGRFFFTVGRFPAFAFSTVTTRGLPICAPNMAWRSSPGRV